MLSLRNVVVSQRQENPHMCIHANEFDAKNWMIMDRLIEFQNVDSVDHIICFLAYFFNQLYPYNPIIFSSFPSSGESSDETMYNALICIVHVKQTPHRLNASFLAIESSKLLEWNINTK